MIIYCSKYFARRYKCRLSTVAGESQQPGKMTSWSAHFFRIGSTPLVLFMHDASLWPILIDVKGVTKIEDLLPLFLKRVMDLFRAHEHVFDEKNQSLIFLPRSNRSLIGSMNDAIKTLKFHAQHIKSGCKMISLMGLEAYVVKTPFSAIDYQSPLDRLRELMAR